MASSHPPRDAARTALVTGAGRGIGRAVALVLARRGWCPLLVSRSPSELRAVADLCREAAPGCDAASLVFPADVADPDDCRAAVDTAVARFGRLDALVNNAGVAPQHSVPDTTPDVLRRALAVNVAAATELARHAWPHLLATRGVIVNVGSVSSIDPFPGFAAYAACKAALSGLTAALDAEGKSHGVRCVCVAPAGVETQMFRDLAGTHAVPTEAILSPEDVGTVIADAATGPLRYAGGRTIYLQK